MTRRSDPPVVLVKWYDFTKWVLGHVDNFPKNQRFVFGQRLADGVITILELIVDATYSERKSKILLEVNRRLEVLRWLLRLAFDRRLLASKQYAYSSEQLTECGRMIGGWYKQAVANRKTDWRYARLITQMANCWKNELVYDLHKNHSNR